MAKQIIVADTYNSAIGIAARSRAECLTGNVVYASDFISPFSLLNHLLTSDVDNILFGWRNALYDLIVVNSNKRMRRLTKKSSVGFVIPDFLGIKDGFSEIEKSLIDFADYYLVTNQDLLRIYSHKYIDCPPVGILHDLPNINLIRKFREIQVIKNQQRAIWIGNSQWGKRQGYRDHKGFQEVILPLQAICKAHKNCFEIRIIDSSEKKFTQFEIFQEMKKSYFVLQSSETEGTGLPVIEGLGLGLIPISTRVGVVPEIFSEKDSHHIVSRHAIEIHEALHFFACENPNISSLMIQKYEKYISKSIVEVIPNIQRSNIRNYRNYGILLRVKVCIKWSYRKLRSKRYA
jgi:glycosyltransferase involved in cell wall biosynthesis